MNESDTPDVDQVNRIAAEELDAMYPPPIDRVDSILDVACSVLADYGAGPGSTRIERLARWVVGNLDACPTMEQAGSIARILCAGDRRPDEGRAVVRVTRIGSVLCLEVEGPNGRGRTQELNTDDARELGTAFFRLADLADAKVE